MSETTATTSEATPESKVEPTDESKVEPKVESTTVEPPKAEEDNTLTDPDDDTDETTLNAEEETVESLIAKLQAKEASLANWKQHARNWEKRHTDLKKEVLVSTVLEKTGLPKTAAQWLTANKEEDLLKQAEELKSFAGLGNASTSTTASAPSAAPAEQPAPVAPVKVVSPNPLQGVDSSSSLMPGASVFAEVSSLFQ